MPMHASLLKLASACALGAAVATFPAAPAAAQAQAYPRDRLNLVVGFAPGGFADTFARLIGQELTTRWDVPVVVENRSGAGGSLAANYVGAAAADGATVLVTTTAIAINETLYPERDPPLARLATVAVPVSSPEVFAVHASRPRNLEGFLAAMEGKEITFATAGIGSGSHIAAEYFLKVLAKASPVHVPFRGGAQSVQAALGDQVDMVAASFGILPLVADGRLNGLAVADAARVEAMPGVPTLAEAGYPFEAASWVGVLVPKETPAEVVEKLNATINEIVMDDAVWKKFEGLGFQRHRRGAAEAATYVAAEAGKWGAMIKAVGITAE